MKSSKGAQNRFGSFPIYGLSENKDKAGTNVTLSLVSYYVIDRFFFPVD